MFNIDVLTEKELIIREKQKKEKINYIKTQLKDENAKLFIDILLNNMPLYLIDLLGDKNLLEFSLFAYKSFENRALDIHYIKGYNEKNLNFLPPNHSLVVSITNDKPFIVDSVREYFFEIKFDRFYIVHPIINVSRDESGNIKKIDEKDKDSVNESVLFLFLENITSSFLKSTENELRLIYNELNFVTNAFNKMTKRITHYKHINDFLTDKVNRFLEWLLHDNFIFMGIKEIEEIKGSIEVRNFGIFEVDELSLDVKYLLKLVKDDKINKIDDQPIYINKYRHKSKIKRREYLDFIGLIKKGNSVNRFYIIVGLFTQDVV
ncbi:MAG: NAD-glutamate dehydrogenase, partial [Deferribacterota bacterium]|nr:NAD-glutamate dehydrogenase [Deferribacterota bacterium]